jgi:hypothetical protein
MEQTFDSTREITLKIPGPSGGKVIGVRFPTDEEWTERQRRRKVILKQLGRGVSETSMSGGEEVDAELLDKIRADGGHPPVDQYEASRLVQSLAECEVDDVVPGGDSFQVSLRVPGAAPTLTIRMPSAKDVTE